MWYVELASLGLILLLATHAEPWRALGALTLAGVAIAAAVRVVRLARRHRGQRP